MFEGWEGEEGSELDFLPENPMWTLMYRDPLTGKELWHIYQDGVHIFETREQVTDVVEANKVDYNEGMGQRFGEGQKVASIPLHHYYANLDEAAGQDDWGYISKWLNNSDNRAWRTFPGRL